MSLENKLVIYHTIPLDLSSFLKKKISEDLGCKEDDLNFIELSKSEVVPEEKGFKFIYDDETGGTVIISFGELAGRHITIEATNSFEIVELYKQIVEWIDSYTG